MLNYCRLCGDPTELYDFKAPDGVICGDCCLTLQIEVGDIPDIICDLPSPSKRLIQDYDLQDRFFTLASWFSDYAEDGDNEEAQMGADFFSPRRIDMIIELLNGGGSIEASLRRAYYVGAAVALKYLDHKRAEAD